MRYFEVIEDQQDDAELRSEALGIAEQARYEREDLPKILADRETLLSEVVAHGFDRETYSQLPDGCLLRLKATGFVMDQDMAEDFFE